MYSIYRALHKTANRSGLQTFPPDGTLPAVLDSDRALFHTCTGKKSEEWSAKDLQQSQKVDRHSSFQPIMILCS